MKKLIYSLIFVFALTAFVSCERDPIDENNSIFNLPERPKTAFDHWLFENYVEKYNIDLKYRFEDIEANPRQNVIPARLRQSEVLAQITQHVWLEAYVEVVDTTFARKYFPKIIHFIGSFAYNPGGTITLGTAEGGLKVTLLGVNTIDEDNIDMAMLNRFFFHTMHHEFAHILHQITMFSEAFQHISNADYVLNNWTTYSETAALRLGFISPYSMMNYFEDFVELFSWYVTNTEEWWNSRLAIARTGNPRPGVTGEDVIIAKMDILRNYFYNVWDIDINHLRNVVLRRSEDVKTMTFLQFSNEPSIVDKVDWKNMQITWEGQCSGINEGLTKRPQQ
jgi:substrate import-associated zinc metallohydrolase lipoprotein